MPSLRVAPFGVIGRLLLASSLLAVVGCSPDTPATGNESADAAAVPASSPTDADDELSIYSLDLPLIDHDGVALDLADLAGRPMIAAMVYTSCKDVCILVTEQMKALERQLAAVDSDVQYALFSLDPGRDTPAAMREFARIQELDADRWRLMAADEDGVRDLAAVLGVRYQEEADGEIAHSAMVFVIDARGVVRHRQEGVRPEADELVAAVKQARR